MTSSRHKFSNRAAIAALLFCLLVPVTMQADWISAKPYKYQYPSQEKIDRQVDSVFRKLSTREKIAQLMIIEFSSHDGNRKLATQKRLIQKEKI